MRCLRCILAFIAAAAALAVLAGFVVVFFIADWLVESDDLQRADYIVVLGGAPERALYAGDLFEERYAPAVLVSRPARDPGLLLLAEHGIQYPREEETNVALLRTKHVPESAIEIFGAGFLSTVDEMEALKSRFAGQTVRLLIVTSPLHTRRARLVARSTFSGSDIKPVVVATPYETLPQRWWTDQYAARNVTLEVIKTVYWMFGGRFRAN